MKNIKILICSLSVLLLAGCASYKDIVYFQDIDEAQIRELSSKYEAKIKKDDQLVIVVSGPDKTVTAPYNLTLGEVVNASTNDPEKSTLSYLVDANGSIDFPILGKIKVEGMTRNELVEYLTREIGKDVKDPIVYVSFKNYKITVLGEVKNPGTYSVESERINVLQALGRAGDLTINAQREGILLIREVNGKQEHYKIDLKNSDILSSPYFYLQQNDVLYIPPSPSRVASGTAATGIWGVALSAVTTTTALVSFILTQVRR